VEAAHGAEIVAAIQRGLAMPARNHPKPRQVEESPSERFAADALWSAVQVLCSGRGIDPALVTDRQEVGELYRSLEKPEAMATHRLFKGWRKEAVGDVLRELLAGKSGVSMRWKEGQLESRPDPQ
jgi:ribonuclease D